MKRRLSRHLGPQAKKALLTAPADEPVELLLQLGSSRDRQEVAEALAAWGGCERSWVEGSRLLTAEAPAGCLSELAELPGVVLVELASDYRL